MYGRFPTPRWPIRVAAKIIGESYNGRKISALAKNVIQLEIMYDQQTKKGSLLPSKCLADEHEILEDKLITAREHLKLCAKSYDMKIAKIKVESSIERETLLKDKTELLRQQTMAWSLISDLQRREKKHNDELLIFTKKFSQFHRILQKSNNNIDKKINDISKATLEIESLKTEKLQWQLKNEQYANVLKEIASNNMTQDQYVCQFSRKLNEVETLCRKLQAEHTSLLGVIKTTNIEPPLEPEIEPPPKRSRQLDEISQNFMDLKKSFDVLERLIKAIPAEKASQESIVNKLVPAKRSRTTRKKKQNQ